jgi:hypothetical protein
MACRPMVAIVAGAVACIALAGCGGADRPPAAATPDEYVGAVEALIAPAAGTASFLAERAGSEGEVSAQERRRLRQLVATAGERLAAFRAMRLGDPVLRRQRDRLAGAYARLVPRMAAVADSLAARDPAAQRAAADTFLDALRALPSAAASSSSR